MGQGQTAGSLTGMNGWTYINDTGSYTPPTGANSFMAIQAVNNAVAVIDQSGTTAVGVEGPWDEDFTLSVGQTIYGIFEQVTLTSGRVIAYHR